MEKKLRVVLLGLLAITVFSTLAIANEECCSKDMKKGKNEKMTCGMSGKMAKKMELNEMFFYKINMIKENQAEIGVTDDQMQKIMVIKNNTKKSLIKDDADIEILVIDFEDALGKDEIDLAATNAIIDKKYAIKAQETKTIVSAMAEIKKFISKDQMKKMHEIWEKETMGDGKCMMSHDKKGKMEGKNREHEMGMSKDKK